MTNSIMPMKYNIILQLIYNAGGLTPVKMYELLFPYYHGERQFTKKELDHQLMSLKTVGLVKVTSTSIDADGCLESNYQITGYGENRAKKYLRQYIHD